MQMGGGLSRRGSRGEGGAPGPGAGGRGRRGERRAAADARFPSGPARPSRTPSSRKRSPSPPPSSSTSARSRSRASRQGEALRDRARAIKEATLQHLDVAPGAARRQRRAAGRARALGRHRRGGARDRAAALPGPRRADGGEVASRWPPRRSTSTRPSSTPGSRRWRPTWASTSSSSPTRSRRTSSRPPSTRPRGRWPSSSRASCAGSFEADPEVLTAVARKALREKFLQADMGITGANFAVADTGTVVLVTNEGNGRMVTSLPRIHVALMGDGEGDPVHDRPDGVPGHPGPERDRTEALLLHDAGARAAAGGGARGAGGVPPDPPRQRPLAPDRLAPCGRRSTACAAGPASTSARCIARSAATPTATRIRAPSASSSPRCSRATSRCASWPTPPPSAGRARTSARCGSTSRACWSSCASISTGRRSRRGRSGWCSRPSGACSCRPTAFRLSATVGRWAQRPFVRDGRLRGLPLVFGKWTTHARPAAGGGPHLPRAVEGAASDRPRRVPRADPPRGRQDPGPLRRLHRARAPPIRSRRRRRCGASWPSAGRRRSSGSGRSSSASPGCSIASRTWPRCPAAIGAIARGHGAKSLVTWDPAALGFDAAPALTARGPARSSRRARGRRTRRRASATASRRRGPRSASPGPTSCSRRPGR